MLGVVTGVWVALSPWFITLQQGGTNANTVNLISGLAVAGVGALALVSPRGFASVQLGARCWPSGCHRGTHPERLVHHRRPDVLVQRCGRRLLIALAAVGLAAVARAGPPAADRPGMRALTQARTRTRPAADAARMLPPAADRSQEHLMSLNRRQQHQLHRIESRLLRSDPNLAAMLTVFASLSRTSACPQGSS